VLADLGLSEEDQAARVIHILNKSDKVDAADREAVLNMFDGAVLTSAISGEGIGDALAEIDRHLASGSLTLTVTLSPSDGAARAWLYEHSRVMQSDFSDSGDETLQLVIDPANWARFCSRWPELVT